MWTESEIAIANDSHTQTAHTNILEIDIWNAVDTLRRMQCAARSK